MKYYFLILKKMENVFHEKNNFPLQYTRAESNKFLKQLILLAIKNIKSFFKQRKLKTRLKC